MNNSSNNFNFSSIDVSILDRPILKDPELETFFEDINKIFEKRNREINDTISLISREISNGAVEISIDGIVVWKK